MDEELKAVVARVHMGDEAAFDELYHLTVRQLFKTMYTYLMTRDDVEDVVQEAYLKLYQVRRRLDDTRSVPVYLRTIAINRARRKFRKRRLLMLPNESDDPFDIELLEGSVREALEKLLPDDRLVLGLFYEDQASIREICTMTGEKEGTIKSRLSRAREKLREVLDHGTQ